MNEKKQFNSLSKHYKVWVLKSPMEDRVNNIYKTRTPALKRRIHLTQPHKTVLYSQTKQQKSRLLHSINTQSHGQNCVFAFFYFLRTEQSATLQRIQQNKTIKKGDCSTDKGQTEGNFPDLSLSFFYFVQSISVKLKEICYTIFI